jgi:hypothetical protein
MCVARWLGHDVDGCRAAPTRRWTQSQAQFRGALNTWARMVVTETECVRAERMRDGLVGPTVGAVRKGELGRAGLNFLVG